jgi:hypothetical protein
MSSCKHLCVEQLHAKEEEVGERDSGPGAWVRGPVSVLLYHWSQISLMALGDLNNLSHVSAPRCPGLRESYGVKGQSTGVLILPRYSVFFLTRLEGCL